jgi:phosphinothricin acetyltransferase
MARRVLEDAEQIVGWASLSPWSKRRAYAHTAEVSVYVHHEHRRRGFGKLLLQDLIKGARKAGLRVVLARVSRGETQASLLLHKSLGFQTVGTMHRVGEKFGRLLDVTLLELQL